MEFVPFPHSENRVFTSKPAVTFVPPPSTNLSPSHNDTKTLGHSDTCLGGVDQSWKSICASHFWPGDGQKECTLFERFHVVLETTRKCQKLARV